MPQSVGVSHVVVGIVRSPATVRSISRVEAALHAILVPAMYEYRSVAWYNESEERLEIALGRCAQDDGRRLNALDRSTAALAKYEEGSLSPSNVGVKTIVRSTVALVLLSCRPLISIQPCKSACCTQQEREGGGRDQRRDQRREGEREGGETAE